MKNYKDEPFIFIAPVTNVASWTDGTIPTSLKGLIDKTIKDYKIDTSRVYVIGFSRGAIGTWNIVDKNPKLFAAAVPVSCCPPGSNAKNFLNTKIRAISGNVGSDEGYYNSCMTTFVNQIKAAGGSAQKITHTGHTHGTIGGAIDYDELIKWILTQKKK